jgi:hypothetical protein
MFGGGDERLEKGDGCAQDLAQMKQIVRDLKGPLQNVQAITVYVGEVDKTGFRKRAANLAYHRFLLGIFPKLTMICMVTDKGTEVIANRNSVLVERRVSWVRPGFRELPTESDIWGPNG